MSGAPNGGRMLRRLKLELRWRVLGYRWFERSPVYCLLHPFRTANELRRAEWNANKYQAALSASWAQQGRIVGRNAMDEELGVEW